MEKEKEKEKEKEGFATVPAPLPLPLLLLLPLPLPFPFRLPQGHLHLLLVVFLAACRPQRLSNIIKHVQWQWQRVQRLKLLENSLRAALSRLLLPALLVAP